MHPGAWSETQLGERPPAKLGRALCGVMFILFLLQFALVYGRLWCPTFLFGAADWPEGLLLVLSAATLLASLNAQLPAQNVILVAVIISCVGGLMHTASALKGSPFGPISFTDRIGPALFHPLPWAIPLLWLVLLLSSRGTARVLLRPWCTTRNYGFWVLGLSVALVVLTELALEPFATHVRGYWQWRAAARKLNWYTAPWGNFLAWALITTLLLAFITPSLINKKLVKQPAPHQPLVVWVLLNGLLASGAATHQLWTAFGLTTLVTTVVVLLAFYGAQAQPPAESPGRQPD